MTNLSAIILHALLALVCVAIIILALKNKYGKRMAGSIVFIACMLLGWILFEILFFASSTVRWSYFFCDLSLPFVAMVILGTYVFVLNFYRLEIYVKKASLLVLLVIPLFTLALAIMAPYKNIIRNQLEIIQTVPVHVVLSIHGPWFWVHSIYCYVLTVVTIISALKQHSSLAKPFRLPSFFIVGGFLISLLCNVVVIINSFKFPFDITLIGVTACMVFMYIATRTNDGMDFFIRSRINIFNDLKEGMLILNNKRQILTRNAASLKIMEFSGISAGEESYDELLRKFSSRAARIEASPDLEGGTDYYFEGSGGKKVFRLFEKNIEDNLKNSIGTFVICNDLTENRKLIKRLDELAGLDALTGLYNRRSIDQFLEEFDRPEYYPLALIAGDLNNLKMTNDTLGHQQGDLMLRAAADTLSNCCPTSARIARTGGDEFLIFLPKTGAAQANKLVNSIKYALGRLDSFPFVISMALGFDVKEDPAQDIHDIISSADRNMYIDKRSYKRRNKKSKPAAYTLP